jgi:hypothetical protein
MSIKNTPVLLVALALVLGPSASALASPVGSCTNVYTNEQVPEHPYTRVCIPDPTGR